MGRVLCFLAMAGLLAAGADETGIRPRPAPADYPALGASGQTTVAAAVVPKEQVGKQFTTDLSRDGYMVMEIAIYPGHGQEVPVAARDFLLTDGHGTALRPASPETIAARYDRKHAPPEIKTPGNVQVYNSSTIGYGTGTYDGRRQGGVYTAEGVGVGVGNPGPTAAPTSTAQPDGYEIRQELQGKSLPEGRMDHTVAGYLYFPKPLGKVGKEGYRLTWYGPDNQVHLNIPLPRK